jgi:hypothetical protein
MVLKAPLTAEEIVTVYAPGRSGTIDRAHVFW